MLLARIGLLVWLLAAPGVGAVMRHAPADAEWGLSPASRPVELERGCRVEGVSIKALSQPQGRLTGGGPGLTSYVGLLAAPHVHAVPSPSWAAVLPDGRDTHLRLAIFLI